MPGKLVLHLDGKELDFENISLLEQVSMYGSISRAAREVGKGYPKNQ
jgi:molybdenum-dependent DNA-binding transcriptional regulator ModE